MPSNLFDERSVFRDEISVGESSSGCDLETAGCSGEADSHASDSITASLSRDTDTTSEESPGMMSLETLRRRIPFTPIKTPRPTDWAETPHALAGLRQRRLFSFGRKPLSLSLSLGAFLLIASSSFRLWSFSIQEVYEHPVAHAFPKLSSRQARRIRKQIESMPVVDDTFTIRLMGSSFDRVQRSLDSHSICPSVSQIQITWSQSTPLPNSIVHHSSRKVTLPTDFETSGVLLLSDDVILSCEDLERAFRSWRLEPSRMVGFFPYRHQQANNADLSQVTPGNGPYTLLSDRAAFVHKLYLSSIRNHPDSACQQMALSIHISSISSQPPVAIAATPFQVRETLEESGYGEATVRYLDGLCVRDLLLDSGLDQLPEERVAYIGR